MELVFQSPCNEGTLDLSLGPVGVASELGGTHESMGIAGLIQGPFRIPSWDEAQALGNPISGELVMGNL